MKLKHFIFNVVALSLILIACDKTEIEQPPFTEYPEIFVAGYLPWYGFVNFDFDALKHIDRVYYFSLAPDANGNYAMEDKHLQYIQQLKNEISDSETELFVVVGGWYESETIFTMAKDAIKTQTYVDSIVQFCVENKLDGIDLDWEAYPCAVPEVDYLNLIDLFSIKLHANNLKFTVAVAASHYNLSAQIKDKVDQINIMSYGILDQNGNQVPMSMLKGWLDNFSITGIPGSKLIVGVPFYAKRPYDASDDSPRAITYSYIVKQSWPENTENKYGKYAYNGRALIQTKTNYLRQNGYFGIMAWELSQDTDYDSAYSLLRNIVEQAK